MDTAPAAVTVVFSEPVGIGSGYLRVSDAGGRDVSDGAPFHPDDDGARLQVALQKALPDASYIASWRVVSEDSHVIAGSSRFVVGDGPLLDAPGGSGSADVPREVSLLAGTARWLGYLGLALIAGLWVLFASVPAPRTAQRAGQLAWIGWGTAVLGVGAAILAQGAESSGRGLGSLLNGDQLDATLATDFGKLHCYALVGLGALAFLIPELIGAAVEERRHGAPEATGLVLAAVIGALSASGHAATASPRALAIAADALHLAAAGAWLGGLAVLVAAVLPHQDPIDARRALRVFSPVAAASVIALIGTGTYQAWRETRSLDALGQTSYGRLVIAKAALLIAIVAVAALTRRAVRRPGQADRGAARAAPRRAIAVEALLGAAVLVLAAALVGQPPARTAYAQELQQRGASATVELGTGGSATLTLDPAAARSSAVTVRVDGTSAQSVELSASLPARGLGPLPIALTRDSGGQWRGQASFPQTGEWAFRIAVRSGEFDAVVAQAQMRLR